MKKQIYEIPLYLVMMIPFVVYGKLVATGLEGFPWFSDNASVLDVFLYHKQSVVIVTSCSILFFIAVMIACKEIDYRDLWHKFHIFLPLAVYVALDIVSSIVSPYREFAWRGMMEQFESIWVIVGYFLICIYSYAVCSRRSFLAFGIFSGVAGAVGTLQFLGMDIYRTDLMQKLCMPKSLQNMIFAITVERGRSYCALSNPNYAGVLCCMTIPVLTVLTFCAEKRRERLLYGVSDVLMICTLIGSRSKSGVLVLAVCTLILAVLFWKKYAKIISIFIIAVVFLAGFLAYQWGAFSNRENVPDTMISEIATNDDNVKIVYDEKTLFFDVDYDAGSLREAVTVVDGKGIPYSVIEEQGTLCFEDESLSQMTAALARYGDYTALEIWDGSYYWYFTNQTEDKTWCYLTRYGKQDKLISNETDVYRKLEGSEQIVSGRGYIWSRTIPLVKNHILLGSGQDSFAAVFPNHDYLGMARWGYKDMIITKPHSMYLQTAVQSGVLSLTVLFVFWGCFFVKVFFDNSGSVQSVLSKAVAVGVMGYLLMGLTNDSNVGSAPVFWMLLGMGVRLCRNKEYRGGCQNF